MLFVIYAKDHENVLEKRLAVRPAHLARLEALKAEGRLVVAGPMPKSETLPPTETGFAGSCVIADFPSLEDAKAWAAADPYIEAGVYASVEITPYIAALKG